MPGNVGGQEPSRRALPIRLAVAVAAVAAAVAVRYALRPLLGDQAPLLLFTLAVMMAARFGGLAAGLLATVLSGMIGHSFFIAPYRGFLDSFDDFAHLVLFGAVGVGISGLSARLQRAREGYAELLVQRRLMAEAVPQLLWTCGPDGLCDYLNTRWVEYTGISWEKQLGFRWLEQVHPEDRAALLQAWNASVLSGADFRTEFRIRRYDGVYRWFDTSALPQRDAAGRIVKWFGSNTDIDEARQAREELRAQQERLSTVAATAPGILCSFRLTPDGRMCFPYASPRIREIYGVEPGDLIEDATPAFDRMHAGDARRVRESVAASARAMEPWREEFRVRRPDGVEIWVEGHSQPSRLPDGSVEWHGFIRDVSDRRRMEQMLRDRTASLEELMQTLDLAHAFVRTLDGSITYWSQGAAGMYGWSREQAIGRRSPELLRSELPIAQDEVQAILLSSGRWEGELRRYRSDGTPIEVASHWALHYDEKGTPISIVEVDNDISERKRAERELRASEERLELAQAAGGIVTWDWHIAANETVWSAGAGRLYGKQDGGGLEPREWRALTHPDDREVVDRTLQLALEGVSDFSVEFRVVPDGCVRWLMGKGKVIRDAGGVPIRMVGVNADITERKEAAEQLRALSASLISAQEEERRRISRELHDDLVQRLALIAMDLGKLAPGAHGPRELSDELRFVQQRAVQAAELARHIAHELHPMILDDLGIASALQSLCEETARREEIHVEFAAGALPQKATREVASALYAVAQEALLNISKHARASRVEVRLDGADGVVRLEVADNGVGLPAGAASGSLGLGLVNMRERVRWLKGAFALESLPEGGAAVRVELPVGGVRL